MSIDESSEKAKRELKKLEEEGGLLATPQLKNKADSVMGHFSAEDVPQNDPVELWGTRIARGLSLIAFVVLAVYLYFTYFS